MKRSTIIYGGAFNPPTRAHAAILEAICRYARRIDAEVWLLPSGERNDKTIQQTSEVRMRYLEALKRDLGRVGQFVHVETSELFRPNSTETIDTVKELATRWPEREFIWVFGSDSVLTMHSWRQGKFLYECLPKIIVMRPGYTLSQLPPSSFVLSVRTPEMSSTLLREAMASGADYSSFVTPNVARAIAATIRT